MNKKIEQNEEVMCLGCGDMFARSGSLDVSPWGHCILCKSKTLRELLSKMNENREKEFIVVYKRKPDFSFKISKRTKFKLILIYSNFKVLLA